MAQCSGNKDGCRYYKEDGSPNNEKNSNKEKGSSGRSKWPDFQSKITTLINAIPFIQNGQRASDIILMVIGAIIATSAMFLTLLGTPNADIYFIVGASFCLIGYLGGKIWPDSTPPDNNQQENGKRRGENSKDDGNDNQIDNSQNNNNMNNNNKFEIYLKELDLLEEKTTPQIVILIIDCKIPISMCVHLREDNWVNEVLLHLFIVAKRARSIRNDQDAISKEIAKIIELMKERKDNVVFANPLGLLEKPINEWEIGGEAYFEVTRKDSPPIMDDLAQWYKNQSPMDLLKKLPGKQPANSNMILENLRQHELSYKKIVDIIQDPEPLYHRPHQNPTAAYPNPPVLLKEGIKMHHLLPEASKFFLTSTKSYPGSINIHDPYWGKDNCFSLN